MPDPTGLDYASVEGYGGVACVLSQSADPAGLDYAGVEDRGGPFMADAGTGGGGPTGGALSRVYPDLIRVYPDLIRVYPT